MASDAIIDANCTDGHGGRLEVAQDTLVVPGTALERSLHFRLHKSRNAHPRPAIDSPAIYINMDIFMPVNVSAPMNRTREFSDDAKQDAGYQETIMSKTMIERHASVWDVLANTAGEAANLKVRAELMQKIASLIHESNWTQAATAEHCGLTQPRINDLLRGRISRFSLDALVNIAAALGQQVRVALEAA